MTDDAEVDEMLRWPEVKKAIGLSKARIYSLVKEGRFPRPIPLTDGGRAVAWSKREILAYQAARRAVRDDKIAGKAA